MLHLEQRFEKQANRILRHVHSSSANSHQFIAFKCRKSPSEVKDDHSGKVLSNPCAVSFEITNVTVTTDMLNILFVLLNHSVLYAEQNYMISFQVCVS